MTVERENIMSFNEMRLVCGDKFVITFKVDI